MSEFIMIHWTTGSLDEARKVARYLVQERLVACANIIPWVESIYMWDNQVQSEQETKVRLKTRRDHFDLVREIIESNTKYEVPEVTFTVIDGGNAPYMEWLEESLPNLAVKS